MALLPFVPASGLTRAVPNYWSGTIRRSRSPSLRSVLQEEELLGHPLGEKMRTNLFRIVTLAVCWGALSHQAFPQTTITCESQNNRRNYCPIADPRSNVDLVRQLGSAECVRGKTWGNDGQGIWVEGGCRAQFRVTPISRNDPVWWNSGSGHRPTNQPQNGACFFKDPNFGGDYFCQPKGSSVNVLPPGLNDKISSIQVYGVALVTFYNDANFKGASVTTRRSIPDLRAFQLQGYDNKTWNNRISSISIDWGRID